MMTPWYEMILPWTITLGFYGVYLIAWADLWATLRHTQWEEEQ